MKHYETMGLPPRCSDAGLIRSTYKKLAMKHHPDKPGGDDETFKKINTAYEILSDEQKKKVYDQFGDAGPPPPQSPFANPFPFPFSGFHTNPQPARPPNVEQKIQLTLKQAYHGTQIARKITITKLCNKCNHKCLQCNGTGMSVMQRIGGNMIQTIRVACSKCKAQGHYTETKDDCDQCSGKAHFELTRTISLAIPPGIKSGHQMVVTGWGKQTLSGSSDLVFRMEVADGKQLKRNNNDLVYTHPNPIPFHDALFGFELVIDEHPTGPLKLHTLDAFGVIIAKQVYRIPGRGMPGGDLVLSFDVAPVSMPDRNAFFRDLSERCAKLTETRNNVCLIED